MMIGELDFCSGNEQFMRPFGKQGEQFMGPFKKKKVQVMVPFFENLQKNLDIFENFPFSEKLIRCLFVACN